MPLFAAGEMKPLLRASLTRQRATACDTAVASVTALTGGLPACRASR